jgi:hypothetical protein
MTERCETCRYCRPYTAPDPEFGACHRFPPPFKYDPKGRPAEHPMVLMNWDWCGEWRARPEDVAPMSMAELRDAGAPIVQWEREP